MCMMCDQYSVHINDDKKCCENAYCFSNQGKINQRKAPNRKPTKPDTNLTKYLENPIEKIEIGPNMLLNI